MELSEEHKPIRPFTAIFDRSGAFASSLALPKDVGHERTARGADDSRKARQPSRASPATEAPPAGTWAFDVRQSLMTGALNGDVYLLRDSIPPRVYLISPAGMVTREFELQPLESGREPLQMSLAGQNGLLIRFSSKSLRSPGPTMKGDVLALLDIGTGKITDTYHLPPGAPGLFACGTVHDEFLFVGTSKDNHLEVVKYVAR